MSISYEGIGSMAVTFPAATCEQDQVCKVDLAGRIAACSAGDKFCGVVLNQENGMAAVQTEGFVTLTYSGTKPSMGYTKLAANGSGGVMQSDNGREYLVVRVVSNIMSITFKL